LTEAVDVPDYESYDYTREWATKQIEDLAEKRILSSWIKPAEACLELGGGYGRLTRFFEPYFSRMVMVDFSRANIKRASTAAREANLVRSEIHRIPCRDDSFDYVFMIRVVHHLADPLVVLKEIQRVSKDGATVVISAPNPNLGKYRRVRTNTLIGEGNYGHRIYVAPLNYYTTECLKGQARRGTGIFENSLGEKLRRFTFLYLVDALISPLWYLKPNIFLKYTVSKKRPEIA
jgi:SAM-dependent methyltransferase